MTPDEYQVLAQRTWKDNEDTDLEVMRFKLDLAILALGLAGEAGEVVEHIKKFIGHGHPLDEHVVMDELGDVRWYTSSIVTKLGRKLHEIDELNIGKLMARYPDGFDPERSLNRQVQDLKAAKRTLEGHADALTKSRRETAKALRLTPPQAPPGFLDGPRRALPDSFVYLLLALIVTALLMYGLLKASGLVP